MCPYSFGESLNYQFTIFSVLYLNRKTKQNNYGIFPHVLSFHEQNPFQACTKKPFDDFLRLDCLYTTSLPFSTKKS